MMGRRYQQAENMSQIRRGEAPLLFLAQCLPAAFLTRDLITHL